jgi:hypothetical protein
VGMLALGGGAKIIPHNFGARQQLSLKTLQKISIVLALKFVYNLFIKSGKQTNE